MSIRCKVEWTGKKISGLVDYGTDLNDDSLPEAKNVLVFLINCLNDNWKLPVGYFCINGLNGYERANLVNSCLEHLHSTGIVICSLTFDGTSCNISMAEKLGCVFNEKNMKTWFNHPISKDPIFVILDPSHMIKLIRNALASTPFYDNNGGRISWMYIEELVNFQEKEGLHAGTKITRQHINYKDQIMKVKLATQTLSNSVSLALNYLESLGIKEFLGSGTTALFVKNLNDIFDFLNGRNILAKGLKAPFKEGNAVERKKFAKNSEEYLKNLTLKNGVNMLKSPRKTGFLGLIISMKSLVGLYVILVNTDTKKLSYILPYKLSQDHLETFFSAIRSRGGSNNNPTSRQFESAYKRILLHAHIKASKFANCTDLDNTKILSSRYNQRIDIDINEVENDDEVDNEIIPIGLNDYVGDVVTYIVGFVIKKMNTIVKCEVCYDALLSNGSPNGLIQIKNYTLKGNLIMPSFDVISLCKSAKIIFRRTIKIYGCKKKNIMIYMTTQLLNNLSPSIIESLKDHQFDNEPDDNHVLKLIKAIVSKYFTIRLHHELKNQ